MFQILTRTPGSSARLLTVVVDLGGSNVNRTRAGVNFTEANEDWWQNNSAFIILPRIRPVVRGVVASGVEAVDRPPNELLQATLAGQFR